MFLPEIHMDLQRTHTAPFDASADPNDDEQTRHPHTRSLTDAAELDPSSPTHGANEWDEWKSVRDVA